MSITDKCRDNDRGSTDICGDGQEKHRISICRENDVRYKRDSIWSRWNINKLCIINNNINTDMYISKLRISKTNGKTVYDITDRDRIFINRGIYSDGCVGILCIL